MRRTILRCTYREAYRIVTMQKRSRMYLTRYGYWLVVLPAVSLA
jgi:hypothetical protein